MNSLRPNPNYVHLGVAAVVITLAGSIACSSGFGFRRAEPTTAVADKISSSPTPSASPKPLNCRIVRIGPSSPEINIRIENLGPSTKSKDTTVTWWDGSTDTEPSDPLYMFHKLYSEAGDYTVSASETIDTGSAVALQKCGAVTIHIALGDISPQN